MKISISYGVVAAGALGSCLIAWTSFKAVTSLITDSKYTPDKQRKLAIYPLGSATDDRIICFLGFGEDSNIATLHAILQKLWSGSSFVPDSDGAKALVTDIFSHKKLNHNLLVIGSEFQLTVWQILIAIPEGTVVTYQEVAQKFGEINYTRAVAGAVGKNNIAYLIPCHRVISKTRETYKYRWSSNLKKKLLYLEKHG